MRVRVRAAMLAAMLSVGGASTAQADFHSACNGAGATAGFAVEGGEFVYRADVRCGDAHRIHISDVLLTHAFGPVPLSTASTAGQECLADLTLEEPVLCQRLIVTGRTTAMLPGFYTVRFTFNVTGDEGATVSNVRRTGQWLWLGAGAPRRQCGGTDAPTTCP